MFDGVQVASLVTSLSLQSPALTTLSTDMKGCRATLGILTMVITIWVGLLANLSHRTEPLKRDKYNPSTRMKYLPLKIVRDQNLWNW